MQAAQPVARSPLVVMRSALIAAAIGLCLVAAQAGAADPPNKDKSGAAATIRITQDPPSVQIEARSKDDAAQDATEDKGGKNSKSAERNRRKHSNGFITFDSDQEFEEFNNLKKTAPWFIGVMFMFVGALFLTPIILLVGIVWYKLRKTRMQNEALLKLAERGVIPPAQVIEAVSTGVMPPAPVVEPAMAAGAPGPAIAASATAGSAAGVISAAAAYEQARQSRRRALWSDLRKGVLLSAIGMSIVAYSAIASGSANWLGLAFLFVGIGYLVLWWLEDRQLAGNITGDLPSNKG